MVFQGAYLMLAALCSIVRVMPHLAPPSMSDTFQVAGTVEFNGTEASYTGTFVIARDEVKKMGYEWEKFEIGRGDITEAIYRYDIKKAYYIRGVFYEIYDCIEEQKNFEEMPKFWNWLSYSTHVGTTTLNEVVYDMWGANVGGVRFELGKPQKDADIAYFYRKRSAVTSTLYSIMHYEATPNATLFNIPMACNKTQTEVMVDGL